MNIDYLREFVSLADTLSFSATARQFYVSQSVLSKHVASMEKELGVPLFVRDSHHVRLTQCGKAFLDEARAIVGSYERALARVAAVNDSFETVVRVGYLRNAARPFLARFLKEMRKLHQEVRVTPQCMEYGQLFAALNTHKIDIAFGIDLDENIHSVSDSIVVYEDCFYAIVNHDHPLAVYGEKGIDAAMLVGYHLLLPDPSSYPGMDTFVGGLLPEDAAESERSYYSDVDTVYLDVELNSVVAFSSGHNIPFFGDRVCFIPINDRDTCYDVSAMWLKDADMKTASVCFDALEICHKSML